MKKDELFELLGEVSEEYNDEAEKYRRSGFSGHSDSDENGAVSGKNEVTVEGKVVVVSNKKRGNTAVRLAAAAAAVFTVVFAGSYFLKNFSLFNNTGNIVTPDTFTDFSEDSAEEVTDCSDTSEPEEKYIDFGVQYTRTDGFTGEKYPQEYWITSEKELAEYYNSNKNKYYFTGQADYEKYSYTEAVKKYDASFFEKNDLLIVLIEEGSGSIQHEVTGVKFLKDSEDSSKHYIQPEICVFYPYISTDDMAEWHILVEVEKEYGKSVSEPIDPVFFIGFGKSEKDNKSEKIGRILAACSDYLSSRIDDDVEIVKYLIEISDELPDWDRYIQFTDDAGEGPYYTVSFYNHSEEAGEYYWFTVNQNMEVIGEYVRNSSE